MGVEDNVIDAVGKLRRRRRKRRIVMGATAVTAALLALLTVHYREVEPSLSLTPVEVKHVTASVEVFAPSKVVLPDGSIVELKNDAELIPDYSKTTRSVTLLKGSAYFQVSKDKKRPFIVTAAGMDVRAVGTAFVVEVASGSVDVMVTEGQVAVNRDKLSHTTQQDLSDLAMLGDGQLISVEFHRSGRPEKLAQQVRDVSPQVMNDRLSWRVPRFEFSGTSLDEVVMMFNQYNRQKLVLADTSLKALELSGFLRADNLRAFVELLKVQFQIEADYRNDGTIILRPARTESRI